VFKSICYNSILSVITTVLPVDEIDILRTYSTFGRSHRKTEEQENNHIEGKTN